MSIAFIPARLEMARAIRQMTATDLAVAASISAPWISQIENVKKTPGPDLVRELARVLNFPVEFFYRPVKAQPPSDAFHFRATSKLAKKDEATARSLSTLAIELSDWIEATYHSPAPTVPEVQDLIGSDDELAPEQAAEAVRGAWGLGVAPIRNLLQLLESKGAKVYSAGGPLQAIDAFSFRHGLAPVIFLNVHKSAERLRFDLAHELGHLVMHGGSLNVEPGKEKEQAANDFASSFLMPRSDVIGAIHGNNLMLEDVLMLKRRWRVSAMALNLRAHRLGVISDWTYSTLAKQLSMAGFRRGEPGSDLRSESSSLLTQVMSDMRSRSQGFAEIARLLDVRAQDVQDLMLGIVTFAIQGDGVVHSRSTADLRDASLAPVADLSARRSRS
ncbi:helix-turn-helix domain-containing protein [Curtobacterium sp. VKM Ac-1393]|uniref:helix-turn-helix domain-containing protein n=1 Tax=Curtobacterium sp. VKM Ac-1393 TaxID=2783814 RepID=UPI00188D46B9|nr:ImmA/IrrE family metallo-endopeptidase [Curtobacterium sp. VKM Ac-1393]MBF4607284.1 ImmA/IrrE family metallo-endopeptidase [Curtobacterium sp. VKM Ac-1393]